MFFVLVGAGETSCKHNTDILLAYKVVRMNFREKWCLYIYI